MSIGCLERRRFTTPSVSTSPVQRKSTLVDTAKGQSFARQVQKVCLEAASLFQMALALQ
jgi:hypothetical protein